MKTTPPPLAKLFYSYPELRALGYPWCRLHIKHLIEQGRFPAPVEIDPAILGWKRKVGALFATVGSGRRQRGAQPLDRGARGDRHLPWLRVAPRGGPLREGEWHHAGSQQ